jgi:hypothetical protein
MDAPGRLWIHDQHAPNQLSALQQIGRRDVIQRSAIWPSLWQQRIARECVLLRPVVRHAPLLTATTATAPSLRLHRLLSNDCFEGTPLTSWVWKNDIGASLDELSRRRRSGGDCDDPAAVTQGRVHVQRSVTNDNCICPRITVPVHLPCPTPGNGHESRTSVRVLPSYRTGGIEPAVQAKELKLCPARPQGAGQHSLNDSRRAIQRRQHQASGSADCRQSAANTASPP